MPATLRIVLTQIQLLLVDHMSKTDTANFTKDALLTPAKLSSKIFLNNKKPLHESINTNLTIDIHKLFA